MKKRVQISEYLGGKVKNIKINDQAHKRVKVICAMNGWRIEDFVSECVNEKLDYYEGMAKEAKK